MEGTVSAAAEIPTAWKSEFVAEYGELPPLPYIAESYDAVIMVALGAEKAQSTDPAKIRDAMRTLNDPSGDEDHVRRRRHQEGARPDPPGQGDQLPGRVRIRRLGQERRLPSGFIEIWKYEGGKIVTVRTEPVTLE